MTSVHGKDTVVKVGANDVSAFCKTSTLELPADVHDDTGYGKQSRTKKGGLKDGKFTCGGTFDNTVTTGPGSSIKPLRGTTVSITYQPEGTGTGKSQDVFSAVVAKYVQTAPFDDLVSWSAEFEISGDVNSAAQA